MWFANYIRFVDASVEVQTGGKAVAAALRKMWAGCSAVPEMAIPSWVRLEMRPASKKLGEGGQAHDGQCVGARLSGR